MDPPPPTTTTTYQESIDSSPRSRATDLDDPFTSKLRLICSYGGHIVPRPHDKSLCYIAGDTRMVVVDRSSTFPDLISRLSKTLLHGTPFTLKYQLPNEDLDSLITVSTDEDLDNMIDEYDRLQANSAALGKPSRIRLFLFPFKPECATSIGSLLDGSNRSEDWFLNALNAAALQRVFSEPPTSVNSLLGLEDNGVMPLPNSDDNNNNNNNVNDGDTNKNTSSNSNSKEVEMEMEMLGNGETVNNKMGKLGNLNKSNPDIHSVPDSPIIETSSPFGSTSSSPSLANLPPIRDHVEEGSVGGGGIRVLGGIDDQFSQMGINVQKQQQQVMDDQGGFVVISSPPTGFPSAAAMAGGVPAAVVGGEFVNRVYSDDERSDHGVAVGGRMVQQQIGQPNVMASQMQHKFSNGGELLSPDSVSSDSSFSNVISRPKPVVYQDPGPQLSSGSSRFLSNVADPNTRIQIQQVSETGYVMPPQYDQQQLFQQQQQQQPQQQSLQQQHQHNQQAQVQQYIPAGAHFVPPGGVPMQAYYPVYPQQSHHLPPQYPVYYVSAAQAQAQAQGYSEAANSNPSSRPQNLPNPTIITNSLAYNPTRNTAPPNPEMAPVPPPVYRTTTGSGPQFVQVPPSQHQPSQAQPLAQSQMQAQAQDQQQQQFMGYSQIHPSQSIAPNSSAGGGYAFDFPDPSQGQIYYPSMTPQYQGVTSAPAVVMPDGSSSQIPIENVKHQIRSSQPL